MRFNPFTFKRKVNALRICLNQSLALKAKPLAIINPEPGIIEHAWIVDDAVESDVIVEPTFNLDDALLAFAKMCGGVTIICILISLALS